MINAINLLCSIYLNKFCGNREVDLKILAEIVYLMLTKKKHFSYVNSTVTIITEHTTTKLSAGHETPEKFPSLPVSSHIHPVCVASPNHMTIGLLLLRRS